MTTVPDQEFTHDGYCGFFHWTIRYDVMLCFIVLSAIDRYPVFQVKISIESFRPFFLPKMFYFECLYLHLPWGPWLYVIAKMI